LYEIFEPFLFHYRVNLLKQDMKTKIISLIVKLISFLPNNIHIQIIISFSINSNI